MQIIKVAQSCRLGNQAELVVGPQGSSNPSKNFIGKNMSNLDTFYIDRQIDYTIFCLSDNQVYLANAYA